MAASFSRGDIVRLRGNTEREGTVYRGPVESANGCEYEIRFGKRMLEWVLENHLELVPSFRIKQVTPNTLQREIALAKLGRRLTDNLFSFGASRTEYKVHQFRPVLKFLRSWEEYGKRGLLIADEVGLGKTIEAAIILQELKARVEVKRVLVICPSRLMQKWQDELQTRFSEPFQILDSDRLRRLVHETRRDGVQATFQVIGSFEMMRRGEFLELLETLAASIDYLIIDEAHYMRNSNSRTNRLGNLLADKASAVTLLSATPLQMGNRDLFHLLQLLAPQDFDDFGSFEQLMEPNKRIMAAQAAIRDEKLDDARAHLKAVRDVFESNAIYEHIVKELNVGLDALSAGKRVELQRLLSDLNVLSAIMNRTRKREFEDDVATRDPQTVSIRFSEEEQKLYDAVWKATRQDYARTHGAHRKPPGFITVMRERQAASCLPAVSVFLERRLNNPDEALGLEQSEFQFRAEEDVGKDDKALSGWKSEDIRYIGNLAGRLSRDTKLEHLLKIVHSVLAEPGQPRILLFSYFRHTLDYLERTLKAKGIAVGVIHGGVNTWTRNSRISQFREGSTFRVMLSSEVGAEGLDFEFCDVLINYDLPWNPMQIEQRIGRLDRFGRTGHEKIRIYNFIIEGTIEERIFSRLYERIKIFEHSVGGLEGILGETINDLSTIALNPDLSEAQVQQRLSEAEERLIRRRDELEAFSKQGDLLLGNSDLLDARVNDSVSQGHVVTPAEISSIVIGYLRHKFPSIDLTVDDANRHQAGLVVNADLGRTLDDFWLEQRRSPDTTSPLMRARAKHGLVQLLFDGGQRVESAVTPEFVNVHHPLVSMGVAYWKGGQDDLGAPSLPISPITIAGNPADSGFGWFVVYVVTIHAVRPRSLLEVVVLHEQDQRPLPHFEAQLLRVIQELPSDASTGSIPPDPVVEEWLDRCQSRMSEKRDNIQRQEQHSNLVRAEQQRRIRTASSATRIRRWQSALERAENDAITRMNESQIRTEELSLRRALDEIDDRLSASVTFEAIAGGRLHIVATSDVESTESGFRSLASAWVRR